MSSHFARCFHFSSTPPTSLLFLGERNVLTFVLPKHAARNVLFSFPPPISFTSPLSDPYIFYHICKVNEWRQNERFSRRSLFILCPSVKLCLPPSSISPPFLVICVSHHSFRFCSHIREPNGRLQKCSVILRKVP